MLKTLPLVFSCSVLALTVSACAQHHNVDGNIINSASNQVEAQIHANQNDTSKAFTLLLDDIWQYELSQYPGLARSKGKKASDLPRQFTDISFAALQTRNDRFVSFRNSLMNIDESALNESERISLLMQKYRLDNAISAFEFKEYQVPITSEYGFHSGLGSSISNTRIETKDDVQVYKKMLHELSEQFAHNIAYMKEGINAGHTQPQVSLKGYEDTISAYVIANLNSENVSEHPFFKAVSEAKEGVISPSEKAELVALVIQANNTYQNFYNFFTQEYMPNAKTDIAAKNWPNGMAFYNNRIKHFTTTSMTAQEVHDVGLKEVARIRADMQKIVDAQIEKGEFNGSINDFINFLRTDERFYAKTPEALIQYASYVAKKMDAKLPQLFNKLPRTPYGVAPVPSNIAPKYTTGRYVSPRRDDQPGYYWVNTYALDKRPLYAIPALTLHEAVPGHHLQISLAAEMSELPEVRRSTYISAFGEGWGLYSEFLGLEVGMYEDPYDNFGRLSYEMWRACRLVVDTGMHVFGWSRDQALAYMLENTALSEHNVRTEIDRYITWPGQALAYKIGEIKIKNLRAKAETELGDAFDLRAFHHAVLENGSIPLFVLEQKVDSFINMQLEAHNAAQ
jgi:uncharacterized protein (DUF885 family)